LCSPCVFRAAIEVWMRSTAGGVARSVEMCGRVWRIVLVYGRSVGVSSR
jgi:hypothetical protein